MEQKEQIDIAIKAAEQAVANILEIYGLGNPYISMKKAKKEYGEAKVNLWLKKGLKAEKRGGAINSKIFIKKSDILLYNK